MDTIVIKVSQREKLEALVQFLKSIDYVSSVEHFDKLLTFKEYFDAVNEAAAATDLSEMTQDEINEEIKAYRSGEQ